MNTEFPLTALAHSTLPVAHRPVCRSHPSWPHFSKPEGTASAAASRGQKLDPSSVLRPPRKALRQNPVQNSETMSNESYLHRGRCTKQLRSLLMRHNTRNLRCRTPTVPYFTIVWSQAEV
eukprot:3349981-Amphidinium_carterae.1